MATTYSNGTLTFTLPLTSAQAASVQEAVAYALGPAVWDSLTSAEKTAQTLKAVDALLTKRLKQDVREWLTSKARAEAVGAKVLVLKTEGW